MIKIYSLLNILNKNSVNFFTGVPDSVLKEISVYLSNKNKNKHVLAVNEGSAVSMGIGYYLAKKKLPCIYMQNSGLSNAINPLISIADSKVYSIPLVLLIGWRGSPRARDEPQHQTKGNITKELLKLLKIKFVILRNLKDLKKFDKLIKFSKNKKKPIACLVENNTIFKNKSNKVKTKYYKNKIIKEDFLSKLLNLINNKTRIISSTGYNSRQILYLRKKFNLKKGKDFYMVGGMGHTSSVSLGYSIFSKNKTICIDGDGSLLMHMGSIKTIADYASNNLKYILLNNNSHESVGGQTTNANLINFSLLSKSLGFKKYFQISNNQDINLKLKKILSYKYSTFVEVKINEIKEKKLPRPKNLIKIKNFFIKND